MKQPLTLVRFAVGLVCMTGIATVALVARDERPPADQMAEAADDFFGSPAKTGKWGWRVEGHHLSVTFTLDRGQVDSPTPFMFGANPATVKAGPQAGLRAIPEVEDLARELIKSLDADQAKVAIYRGA